MVQGSSRSSQSQQEDYPRYLVDWLQVELPVHSLLSCLCVLLQLPSAGRQLRHLLNLFKIHTNYRYLNKLGYNLYVGVGLQTLVNKMHEQLRNCKPNTMGDINSLSDIVVIPLLPVDRFTFWGGLLYPSPP